LWRKDLTVQKRMSWVLWRRQILMWRKDITEREKLELWEEDGFWCEGRTSKVRETWALRRILWILMWRKDLTEREHGLDLCGVSAETSVGHPRTRTRTRTRREHTLDKRISPR
jgi:hypothetical protein